MAGSEALGTRLREERRRHGWDKPRAARELARVLGHDRPDHSSLITYLKRWENGTTGISERYRLALAAIYGIPRAQLSPPEHPQASLWRPIQAPDTTTDPMNPDDEERLTAVSERPSRLDRGALDALAAVLSGQRRIEDALGPALLLGGVSAQLDALTRNLRDVTGPLREPYGRVVAEWTCYTGWLHAALRRDAEALALFGHAEELADDFGDGTIAAVATSFRGYVARRQGRPRGIIRASRAALATPGGHPTQTTFDLLQAAQGYTGVGEEGQARRLLDEAAERASRVGEPPPAVYWYSEAFFALNIGMVLLEIGQYRDAADMLRKGMDGMPQDQRGAEWMYEYRDALVAASERA